MTDRLYTTSHDFSVGSFGVSPILNQIQIGSAKLKIEPLIMDALVLLATQPGEVVLRSEFLAKIWDNANSSDESLTRAMSKLRRIFVEHDPKTEYIQTVPKRGYRLLLDVEKSSLTPRSEIDELVLQARSLNARPFHSNVLYTAIELLEDAIQMDETHALALCELGHAYSLLSTYVQEGDKREYIRKSAAFAERALEKDPNIAFAMTLIALEKFTLGKIVDAINLTEKAYSLDSKDPEIALRLGYFYAAIGHLKHAIPYLEQAVKSDPTQGRNFQILATARLANGDFQVADDMAKKAIDMQHHFGCETYAAIAFAMGNYEEAGKRLLAGRIYLSEFLGEKFLDDAVWEQIISAAYSPEQKVRETLGGWVMKLLHTPGNLPSIPLAQTIVRTGPASAFFEIMGDTPPPGTHGTLLCIWGQTDNCLAIRNSAEFMPFARRMGMVDAWEKYGNPDVSL